MKERHVRLLQILSVCFGMMTVISAGFLWNRYLEYERGEEEYIAIRRMANADDSHFFSSNSEVSDAFYENELPEIDERKLKEINSEYAAWIYIPDTSVNYPVVIGKDNRKYLNQSFEGKCFASGSLFFDSKTIPFSSGHAVIYGHNMKSGKMFGSLKKYMNEAYAKEHETLFLFCRGKWKMYRFLSVRLADCEDVETYFPAFPSKSDFETYKERKSRQLLTLSTCHGKSKKLLIQWTDVPEEDALDL